LFSDGRDCCRRLKTNALRRLTAGFRRHRRLAERCSFRRRHHAAR